MTGPPASVVIPVSAAAERLARTVEAVRAQSVVCEVVVVANGGVEVAGHVRELVGQDARVVATPVNRGFGGGANLGALHATGETLVFSHDDAVLEPHAVAALLDALDAPHTGAAGTAERTATGEMEYGRLVVREGWTAPFTDAPAGGEPTPVDYCGTTGLAIRRATFTAVGGFDAGFYPAYFSDVDLAFRLRARGLLVVCVPDALVHHLSGASTTSDFKTFIGERNRARFVDRWSTALVTHAIADDRDAHRSRIARTSEAIRTGTAGPQPESLTGWAIDEPDEVFWARSVEVSAGFSRFLEGELASLRTDREALVRSLEEAGEAIQSLQSEVERLADELRRGEGERTRQREVVAHLEEAVRWRDDALAALERARQAADEAVTWHREREEAERGRAAELQAELDWHVGEQQRHASAEVPSLFTRLRPLLARRLNRRRRDPL